MKQRITAIITAVIIFVIIIFGSALVRLYTDWLWFEEINHAELFLTPIKAKLALGVIVGLAAFVLLYINVLIASRGTSPERSAFRFVEGKLQIDATKYTKPIALAVMAVLAFFTGLASAASWETVLQYLNATPFNTIDPVFSRDLSFYFFTLPFVQFVLGLFSWILMVALITAAILYAGQGAISRTSRFFSMRNKPGAHLGILLALLFVDTTIRTMYVKIPNLLYSTTGPFVGASHTDLHANLPLLKLMAVLSALVAFITLVAVFKKKHTLIAGAIVIYVVVAITGRLYPAAVQKFIVLPNELTKESPQITQNITATQAAFGLNAVETRDLEGATALTNKNINNNQSTINNIRLWDREPLLDTFGQLQEIRTYYDFVSIDNDRYQLNGQYRQVLLSPRELNTGSLPSRTFVNEQLTFTHGYGLTLGPVNEVTSEGLPLLFVKDIPPTSTIESLKITRPEIYYGELVHDPVFVSTTANEFDYPSGDENVFTKYEGTGGVPVDNLLRKALLALRFGSLKIFLADDITAESRAMYHRDIKERVSTAVPFLQFDYDPYLVIDSSGRLKWIQDAYTTSNRYPYAEYVQDIFNSGPLNQLNYIRNSVKIVIDAYDGSMHFYIADPNDPLIQTYEKIFPNSFVPLSEIPDDLRAHLRYPEDLFSYQSTLYKTYHMEEPQIFYNKEDQWQIPSYGRSGDPMMRHLIMKLPGEDKEEFILMLPFTPRGKDNMAAWMVARSDGEHYGKLVVYRFPKQKLVFGPTQIVNRINQDAEISRQISLWDQRGSKVIRGNLLVIPIEESLLYVQPLYLKAEGGRIPELKRIIVAYENQIAMEETLDAALARIFSGIRVSPTTSPKPVQPAQTNKQLLQQGRNYYDRALQAQRAGNWAQYGEEIRQLGEVLKKLK